MSFSTQSKVRSGDTLQTFSIVFGASKEEGLVFEGVVPSVAWHHGRWGGSIIASVILGQCQAFFRVLVCPRRVSLPCSLIKGAAIVLAHICLDLGRAQQGLSMRKKQSAVKNAFSTIKPLLWWLMFIIQIVYIEKLHMVYCNLWGLELLASDICCHVLYHTVWMKRLQRFKQHRHTLMMSCDSWGGMPSIISLINFISKCCELVLGLISWSRSCNLYPG